MLVEVRAATSDVDLCECQSIRYSVFVREQGIDSDDEFDNHDSDCRHYLAWLGRRPVATARVRPEAREVVIDRVAVIGEARGKGVGRRLLMRVVAEALRRWPDKDVVMAPQVSAVGFYAGFGFTPEGGDYFDHGAMRRKMRHLSASATARNTAACVNG